MAEKNHIVRAINSKAGETAEDAGAQADDSALTLTEEVVEPDQSDWEAEDYFDEPERQRGWLAPAMAIAAVVGWTAFYFWAIQGEMVSAESSFSAQLTRWIVDWSVPVLLIGVGWLIAMRNSRAEARRFADTASMLSAESAQLEHRLNVVNRELSLAREFLAAQSLELESLGRVASEKISTHASELQSLIRDNGAQVDRIGSASETALSNMTQLRDDLPVVANSARDVSNQVANAGRTAHEQLEKLVSGFERLNEFGTASENQVEALGRNVGDILAGFEAQLSQIEHLVTGRFVELQERAGGYRSEITSAEEASLSAMNDRITMLQAETKAVSAKLRDAEIEAMEQLKTTKERFAEDIANTVASLDQLDKQALAAASKRIEALNLEASRFDQRLGLRDARFLEEMERRQDEFETREAQASEIFAQRLADLDEAIAERREAQNAETEKLVAHGKEMTAQLDELGALIERIGEQGDAARANLTEGLGALDEQLAEKRAALAETEQQLGSLTEAGIRLLEIIQSGRQHSREDLSEAIRTAGKELETVEQRAEALSGIMLNASQRGTDLSEYLVKTQETISETDASIEELKSKLAEHSDETLAKLQGLRSGFAKLAEEGHSHADEARQALTQALEALEASTKTAFETLDQGAREKVNALAHELSKDAVEALERALKEKSAESVEKLEQAATHASGVGREATIHLRDQLAKVNELAGNLEQRVARARELAEEQVNNDFSRRMSLITDSLNSNAIDIAGALSQDVSDTAWDAYLKGDRGIFTRRAVRLIDSGDAREISDLYQRDDAFRANVSRYIHDFEKMLRSMLSTRDGNALGVTVLGSDMGKLYVILAQAIERFRN
ncbi:ATPase [Erythrobacter sp. THAF29]|uniref:ATPase n=1 Tax=Erythrobacter sp. THAF29 TaxID=2587851 RepID=UPI001267B11B|nr:ATPase [Erythrobacter sp. THAF29]QFT77980.1 hypothetical protein FIU90_10575 [Erythrobacter sp. THAF29]